MFPPRLLRLVLVLVLLAATALAAAAKPKRTPCPDGRFRLEGGTALVTGGGPQFGDAVVLRGGKVAVDSGCGAVRSQVKATKRATVIRSSWKSCGTLRRVRLTAEIQATDCNRMTGKRKAKGVPPVRFAAVRSRCDDGFLDRGAPEGCDSGVGCEPGSRCEACACVSIPTTTLPAPPTTVVVPLSTTSTSAASTTTTTTLPPDVCGDGEVTGTEPCDPMAFPSGCPPGQQCDMAADRCACGPIPEPLGTIVAFTAPPLPDPTALGLPAVGDGTFVLNTAPGAFLRLDPSQKDPVTAVARCTRWIGACLSPPERTLDDCARSAPHCQTSEPWLEVADCCPAACFPAYEARRAAGVAPILALEQAYFDDGACFPGLRALLERD